MELNELRISVVNYINSRPFIDSLLKNKQKLGYQLSMDVPAECANKLENCEADVGLVPVAVLANHPNYEVISDFCIGANGAVRTVVLVSNTELHKIDTIYIDPHSRSSNELAKILANELWNINPKWKTNSNEKLIKGEGQILIGDKVFDQEGKYTFSYDLAEEWKTLTGLPFVFAVWASNQKLSNEIVVELNKVLEQGIQNLQQTISTANQMFPKINLEGYFTRNISYQLSEDKKTALNLYLQKLKQT